MVFMSFIKSKKIQYLYISYIYIPDISLHFPMGQLLSGLQYSTLHAVRRDFTPTVSGLSARNLCLVLCSLFSPILSVTQWISEWWQMKGRCKEVLIHLIFLFMYRIFCPTFCKFPRISVSYSYFLEACSLKKVKGMVNCHIWMKK